MPNIPDYYECDPSKHTQCSRSGCLYNENSNHRVCHMTKHKEFSVGGIPISKNSAMFLAEMGAKKDDE